jgi:hypothetical protein
MEDAFSPGFYSLAQQYKTDATLRARVKHCQLCGQNIEDRHAALYKGLIEALYQVYCWCGEKKCHEFTRHDIAHLLRNGSNFARFGDLIRFGGLVYKRGRVKYGLNMGRCKEFFRGERQIPVQITLNQLTNEIIESRYVKVGDFPELSSFLGSNGMYDYEKDLIHNSSVPLGDR